MSFRLKQKLQYLILQNIHTFVERW